MEDSISVIIPVLNEDENLRELLPLLNAAECIVVDANTSAETQKIVTDHGAVYVGGEKGRAIQCNLGARKATSNILYFLHADCRPAESWCSDIRTAVANNFVGGCFKMRWNSGHILLRFFSWLTQFFGKNFRGGDQSLFVTKAVFDKIGGYKNMALFEDVEIIERISKEGKFKVVNAWIISSARRYNDVGVFRLQWYYAVLHTMYRFGFSAERLKRRYDKTVGAKKWN